MDVLQENARHQTIRTLEYISSVDELLSYKKNVPFVHIGYELMAQCDTIHGQLSLDWYREIWTDVQLAALTDFSVLYLSTSDEVNDDLPDVPDLLDDLRWVKFMQDSQALLAVIREGENGK